MEKMSIIALYDRWARWPRASVIWKGLLLYTKDKSTIIVPQKPPIRKKNQAKNSITIRVTLLLALSRNEIPRQKGQLE